MKALSILLALSLSTAASASASASEIKYEYLEASKQQVKAGDLGKFEGSGFAGSMLIGENIIVSASRRKLDTNLSVYGYSANLESSQFNLGFGFKAALSESADFFILLEYVDFKTTASVLNYSLRSSESGKGGKIGFRSMASDNLELTGYLKVTDVISSETSVVMGAHYHLNSSFSIGVNYEKADEERGTSIIARIYL